MHARLRAFRLFVVAEGERSAYRLNPLADIGTKHTDNNPPRYPHMDLIMAAERTRNMANYLTVKDIAAEIGTNNTSVLGLASREEDPLPLRYIKGKKRTGFVIVSELNEWIDRNTCFYNERDKYASEEDDCARPKLRHS